MKHQITESQYFCSCPTFSSWRYSVDFILYIQTLPQIFQHHNKFACQTTKEPTEKKNRHNRKDRKEIHLNFSRNASKNVKKPRGQSFSLSRHSSLCIQKTTKSHYLVLGVFWFSLLTGKSICV